MEYQKKQIIMLFTRLLILTVVSLTAGFIIWSRFVVWELQDVSYAIIDKCSQSPNAVQCFTDGIALDWLTRVPNIGSIFMVLGLMIAIDVLVIATYFIKDWRVFDKWKK